MAESTFLNTQQEQIKIERLWWVGLLAAVVAVIGNILVQVIASAAYTIPAGFQPFQIPRLAIFTVVGVAGATGVFALLGRFTQRPVRWFWITSVVVLLLSFIPNILMLTGTLPVPGTTVPGVISLMIIHIVAAAAAVGILPRAARAS
jgi:hypothetical protein